MRVVSKLTEDAILPDVAEILGSFDRHFSFRFINTIVEKKRLKYYDTGKDGIGWLQHLDRSGDGERVSTLAMTRLGR
jgi:hypothetical protein